MEQALNGLIIRTIIALPGERGQSISAFSLILFFALVAVGIAAVLLMSGDFLGGDQNSEFNAPNFEPPNPLD